MHKQKLVKTWLVYNFTPLTWLSFSYDTTIVMNLQTCRTISVNQLADKTSISTFVT